LNADTYKSDFDVEDDDDDESSSEDIDDDTNAYLPCVDDDNDWDYEAEV
jgi:hypothetical protein